MVTAGAALGTLAALLAGALAGDLLHSVPSWLTALLVTFFFVAGYCLANAYIKFEWATTCNERTLEAATNQAAQLEEWVPAFPAEAKAAERWWIATRLAVILVVLAFLAALWWPTVASWRSHPAHALHAAGQPLRAPTHHTTASASAV